MSAPSDITSGSRMLQIFREDLTALHRRTDRMFAWIMLAQWVAAVVAALVISPFTWIGEQHRVHEHVWLALGVGGALASLPIAMTKWRPGSRLTRHVIAVAQMLFSALLIHLTGGRIETHFHVFGSLAFLAFYRDWSVLLTATVVVALDHMLRGIFVPLSVFGTTVESPWRWVEHAGWVAFEDVVLVLSCVRGISEMQSLAERQAHLEEAKAATEAQVLERTKELQCANQSLQENETALRTANQELLASAAERESLHGKLVVASREAGMAEVATGVLHNVGNVLNSVNVSATVVGDKLRQSEVGNLKKAAEMIREHIGDLPRFLSDDARGRHLPTFLIEVAGCLSDEQTAMLREVEALSKGVDHIKHVIHMQQSHAKLRSVVEVAKPEEIMEAALQMQLDSLLRHDVEVVRRFEPIPPLPLDKHRILQILTNLISNAKEALARGGTNSEGRRLTLCVRAEDGQEGRRVQFEVGDNGIGIAPENLERMFSLGFTTRKDGHGFGLHSAATAAQEMGGSLTASSRGIGQGAVFTLAVSEGEQGARRNTAKAAPERHPG